MTFAMSSAALAVLSLIIGFVAHGWLLAPEFPNQKSKAIDFVRMAQIPIRKDRHGRLGAGDRHRSFRKALRVENYLRHIISLP